MFHFVLLSLFLRINRIIIIIIITIKREWSIKKTLEELCNKQLEPTMGSGMVVSLYYFIIYR